jgi:phosphoribosylaminoimidazolecarboxamide formyltransferase/IMP cyclohydrolase
VGSEGEGRVPVRRALLSVYDTSGLVELARSLERFGVEIYATQGTRRALEDGGVHPLPAEDLTGIGEWFGGRIKTLHPGLLGGVLAPRTPAGEQELAARHLKPFDLVVVNFYPFAEHFAAQPRAPDLEEFIDVGGVTLARAAAKNHASVIVITAPAEYAGLVDELNRTGGGTLAGSRRRWAASAFARTQAYDRRIATALAPDASAAFPDDLSFVRDPVALRYGENPHQPAQPYVLQAPAGAPFAPFPVERLQGDPLSFTNYLDLDTALAIVAEFPTPTAAVVKHATPTGVASGATLKEALERAVATDPVARYGCAIAVNRPLEGGDSGALHGVFVDLLAAPEVAPGEREALTKRKKLKLLKVAPPPADRPRWEVKSALGRLLVQSVDQRQLAPGEFRQVTTRGASPEERCALDFAWRVVRHAKSNAVVLAHGSATVGIGSGQPTRVKAVELARDVAGPRARGAVLASDAFFPFADGVDAAAAAGVSAILQPGGSLRDPEVIAAAERAGMAMYLTGWRVFRH